MNKAILAGIVVFALLGAILSASMIHSAYAADSKEKTVKKDTKITAKKDTKTTKKDTKTPAKKDTKKDTAKPADSTTGVTVEMAKGSGDNESCAKDNKCYSPSEIKVAKGGTVTWVNKDSAVHTATSGTIQSGPDGKFDSGPVATGAKFSQKFDTAGTYEYFDMVHPWMKGKVIVS